MSIQTCIHIWGCNDNITPTIFAGDLRNTITSFRDDHCIISWLISISQSYLVQVTKLRVSSTWILNNLSSPLRFETSWGISPYLLLVEEGWAPSLLDSGPILMAGDLQWVVLVSGLKLKSPSWDTFLLLFHKS